VSIPLEFSYEMTRVGDTVTVLDTEGAVLGDLEVSKVEAVANRDHTVIVKMKAPRELPRASPHPHSRDARHRTHEQLRAAHHR
jgi:hypothetical protein